LTERLKWTIFPVYEIVPSTITRRLQMSIQNPLLPTTVAGIRFPGYVCNASGPRCTKLEQLQGIARSGSAAIITKSATLEPRYGNESPRFAWIDSGEGALQSMGLPNLGYLNYTKFAQEIKETCGKPIVASVAGLDVEHFPIIVEAFQRSPGIDLIELNPSCPNTDGDPIAYDLHALERLLKTVSSLGEKPIGIKLPFYPTTSQCKAVAEMVLKHEVRFVTCINSVGNALAIDMEKRTTLIRPKEGFGGLSGSPIKHLALGSVRLFSQLLGDRVSIFGVGGIRTGRDAFEFLLAGADAVQVGTKFELEGPDCFTRIERELRDILQRKGYASVSEAKGQLSVAEPYEPLI
jgi:dihydroorotate dehydrogenase (fumarate)